MSIVCVCLCVASDRPAVLALHDYTAFTSYSKRHLIPSYLCECAVHLVGKQLVAKRVCMPVYNVRVAGRSLCAFICGACRWGHTAALTHVCVQCTTATATVSVCNRWLTVVQAC